MDTLDIFSYKPGSGGAGAVSSVFTRAGDVVAAASDYNASEIDNDSTVTGTFVDDALNNLDAKTKRILSFVFDGAGSVIEAGAIAGYYQFPFSGTITKAVIRGNPSGSAVVDIWKLAYSTSANPTVSNTITASAKPTISSAVAAENTTLTGWTTSITAKDVFAAKVDSCTTCTRLIVELEITI